MSENLRTISNYPDDEREIIFLTIIGIENNKEEIERQKNIALEEKVYWLIHLREVSEEIQLY